MWDPKKEKKKDKPAKRDQTCGHQRQGVGGEKLEEGGGVKRCKLPLIK